MDTAVYLRVSTAKQVGKKKNGKREEGKQAVSLDQQLARGIAYCEGLGLGVAVIFREAAVSGGKPLASRPCGAELRELARQGIIKNVVAWDGSRLFRDSVDSITISREWDKKGVAVHLVNEGGKQECRSASDKTMRSMKAVFNEHQRLVIGENTRAALQHKRERMEPYCRSVFGFDRQDDTLVPNPAEQRLLKRIKRMYSQGQSLRAIAAALNNGGVATKRGGAAWYASTVKGILQNELHAAA